MTAEQITKANIMKIISILCLVVVIVSGFLPWATIQGNLGPMLGQLETFVDEASEEETMYMQEMLDKEGIDLDLNDVLDTIEHFFDSVADNAVAPMDFLALYTNCQILTDFMYTMAEFEEYGFVMDSDVEMALMVVSTMALVPVAFFGLIAIMALLRIILRVFNRRGLGVTTAVFTGIYAALMSLIFLVAGMIMQEELSIMMAPTLVPLVAFVFSVLGCVFWGIARRTLAPKAQPTYAVPPTPGQEPPVPSGQVPPMPRE